MFMPLVECLDVGGTRTRYALVQDGRMMCKEAVSTPRAGMKALMECVQLLREKGRAQVKGRVGITCVGLPGPVKGTVLLNAAPLGLVEPFDFAGVRDAFGNSLVVENDLNVAVRAEQAMGIGKDVQNFYLLALSTGIGAGIVLNGKIVRGLAGEFGHCVLDASSTALPCACGHKGCWAAYSSGMGLEAAALKESGVRVSAMELFDGAIRGDERAQRLVARARDFNARGLGLMVNALEVQSIAVMGSIGLNRFETVIPRAGEIGSYSVHPVPPIVPTILGGDIGLWGAYHAGLEFLGSV